MAAEHPPSGTAHPGSCRGSGPFPSRPGSGEREVSGVHEKWAPCGGPSTSGLKPVSPIIGSSSLFKRFIEVKINHFRVSNSVAVTASTVSRKHHLWQVPEHFHVPQREPCTISWRSLLPPPSHSPPPPPVAPLSLPPVAPFSLPPVAPLPLPSLSPLPPPSRSPPPPPSLAATRGFLSPLLMLDTCSGCFMRMKSHKM